VAWAERAAHWPATAALVEKVDRAATEPMVRMTVTRPTATLAATVVGAAPVASHVDQAIKASVVARV
jgi:hypothetical protein